MCIRDSSTISHEIRNPLTLVYSMLQMIETAHPEVSTFKHWSDLHQNIEYMNQLLEELSSYNNGERLNISQIETNSFLKTLVLSFASSLVDTDIAVSYTYLYPCRFRDIRGSHFFLSHNITTVFYLLTL